MRPSAQGGTRRTLLTARVAAGDALFARQLYGLLPGYSPAPYVPDRLVVDAHVPLTAQGAGIAPVARQAGVPFLIDPETYYLQDNQSVDAPWCKVPYANSKLMTSSDLATSAAQDDLIRTAVNYQLENGATAVIAPYVHIEKPALGWEQVQEGLWRRTADYLRRANINVPVIAVAALGWRCMTPTSRKELTGLWSGLAALAPAEVAIAASKAHAGANPTDRIAELLLLVRDLSRDYTVTMWQQGALGEACVIAGATGYECGIGRREKCDLQNRMGQYRKSSPSGPRPPRNIYIHQVGQAVSKRRLELARSNRSLWSELVCHTPGCCAPAGADLLGDARRHSIITRAHALADLRTTAAPRWQWNQLAQRLEHGIALAERINELGPSTSKMPKVDTSVLHALYEIADSRRRRQLRSMRRSAADSA